MNQLNNDFKISQKMKIQQIVVDWIREYIEISNEEQEKALNNLEADYLCGLIKVSKVSKRVAEILELNKGS